MASEGQFEDQAGGPLEQAARWRLRLTEAGLKSSPQLEAWLAEPANRAAWDQLSGIWDRLEDVAQAPEMMTARQAALADARAAKTARLRARIMAIAATLLIGLTAMGSYWWLVLPDDYRTAIGERRVITLSDGSKLSLDADSEVTVRYGQHARSLHLLKGQARFDVAHDKSRPFSVVAGNQKVIATGTAFNIDMAGPKVLVTLIEGHVVVLQENGGGSSPTNLAVRPIELRAGQQLAAGPALTPQVSAANIQRVNAWTIGQIMFDDEPLSSVVERVNRYGGMQIVIGSPEVGAMKISGVFNAGDTLGFVEIVTHYLPVKAVSESSRTIALESAPKKNGI
jgi:transmembrane sensor